MVNAALVGLGLSGLLLGPCLAYKALRRSRLLRAFDRVRAGDHEPVDVVRGHVAGSVDGDAVDRALADSDPAVTAWKLEEWKRRGT